MKGKEMEADLRTQVVGEPSDEQTAKAQGPSMDVRNGDSDAERLRDRTSEMSKEGPA